MSGRTVRRSGTRCQRRTARSPGTGHGRGRRADAPGHACGPALLGSKASGSAWAHSANSVRAPERGNAWVIGAVAGCWARAAEMPGTGPLVMIRPPVAGRVPLRAMMRGRPRLQPASAARRCRGRGRTRRQGRTPGLAHASPGVRRPALPPSPLVVVIDLGGHLISREAGASLAGDALASSGSRE